MSGNSKSSIADQSRVHAFRAFKLNTKLMWEASAKLVTQVQTAGGGAVPQKTLEFCLRDPREIKKVRHYVEGFLRQPQMQGGEHRADPELREAMMRARAVLGGEKQKPDIEASAGDPCITTYFEAYNLSKTLTNLAKAGVPKARITPELVAAHAQAPHRILANIRPEQIRARMAAHEVTTPADPVIKPASEAVLGEADQAADQTQPSKWTH